MPRIIINYKDMEPQQAMYYVSTVIASGRCSESRGIAHFSWATVFKDGTTVYVNKKKTESSADSFVVIGDNNEPRL